MDTDSTELSEHSVIEYVDTHCHIHDTAFDFGDTAHMLSRAKAAGVSQLIVVGTSGETSESAVRFAQTHHGVFASIGLHPHDAKLGEDTFETIARLIHEPKVIAIGEFGLDFYYRRSTKAEQLQALEYQLYLAQTAGLPCIFHVREAFADFWPVFDNFRGVEGVIHSFSATTTELDAALNRGLYVGINGIMTFTHDQKQLDALRAIPLTSLLLETDAPFLTPTPKRGNMNEPANVELVAAFAARLRGEPLEQLSKATTANARRLFRLPARSFVTTLS